MIEVHCDICDKTNKFRSGITGDYRLWVTTIELHQTGDSNYKIPSNHAVDICSVCRNALRDWTSVDSCLIKALKDTLKRKEEEKTMRDS